MNATKVIGLQADESFRQCWFGILHISIQSKQTGIQTVYTDNLYTVYSNLPFIALLCKFQAELEHFYINLLNF